MTTRHFLSLMDCSEAELIGLIKRGIELKSLHRQGVVYEPLKNRVLGMIFEKASTRTRVSFEAGMIHLGGQAIFLSPRDTQLGRGEPIEDSARVLSSMCDAIMIRTDNHDTLLELAYTLPEGVLSRLLGNAGADRLGLGLRATTKLPTASAEKGLGTGERDYSIQLDASLPLGGQLLFGSLGYTRRGESAVYSDILSSPFAQLGIARSVSERLSIGALYDYRQSASSLYGDGQELSVYGSLQIDPHWSVSGLVGAGLVSASSDLGVYVLVAYRW